MLLMNKIFHWHFLHLLILMLVTEVWHSELCSRITLARLACAISSGDNVNLGITSRYPHA